MTSEFQREDRYTVIKDKHLNPAAEADLARLLVAYDIPDIEGVVVEKDWPIYEQVWSMIQAMAEGEAAPQPDTVVVDGVLACLATVDDKLFAAVQAAFPVEARTDLVHEARRDLKKVRALLDKDASTPRLAKTDVWQFYQDGEWRVGSNDHNHRENTEKAGFKTRDLYAFDDAK